MKYLLFIFIIFSTSVSAEVLSGINGNSFSPPDPLTSYSYKDNSNWTWWNKVWFGSALGTYAVGDIVSTRNAIDRGCVEANPLFGDDPSVGVMLVSKTVVFGLAWWYLEYGLKDSEEQQITRNILYGAMTIFGGGLTVYNMNVNCD